jgi:hypothetical protein
MLAINHNPEPTEDERERCPSKEEIASLAALLGQMEDELAKLEASAPPFAGFMVDRSA